MRNRSRDIVIDNQTFRWRYQQYVRDLPHHTSRLCAFNKEDDILIEIFFYTHDTWTSGNPLNEGLPMKKNGETHIVNLNQPGYVAELIKLVLNNYLEGATRRFIFHDGNKLLHELGYREDGFCYLKEG